jgi:16S rRNA G966 N2-methylase RsmD
MKYRVIYADPPWSYDDISRVMSVFNVKRSEAYDLIKKGKAIKDESPERNKL